MQSDRNTAESVAEDYYDSNDADKFYELVWGGEDIHIGLYEPGMSVFEASRRTVEKMAGMLGSLDSASSVIDLGAGYGGSGRYLAGRFGCHATCLNLSEVQNQRNRELNRQQGLEKRVKVLHGSFEQVPEEDRSFDVVWSQDAFLHSGQRATVLSEIARILKPGGQVIFTDPMQADDCPEGVLQPVYDRLSLQNLASPGFYREHFQALGFQELAFLELTHQLRTHYASIRDNLRSRYQELSAHISTAYLDRMIAGLGNWVDAADRGYLAWGIFHFRKPD